MQSLQNHSPCCQHEPVIPLYVPIVTRLRLVDVQSALSTATSVTSCTLLPPVTVKARLALHSREAKCLSHSVNTGEPSCANRSSVPPVEELVSPEAVAVAARRSISSPARRREKVIV